MQLNDITDVINKYNNFMIFTHANPDGDAFGSSTALALSLNSIEKKSVCIFDSEITDKYDFLKRNLEYHVFFDSICCNPECVITVDCASFERIGRCSALIKAGIPVINIDHHVTNNNFGTYNYIIDSAASAIPVYRIIKCLNININRNIAEALFCALVTDTGHFSYSCTNKEVFNIIIDLLDCGLDIPFVSNSIYFSRSLNATKLIEKFIHNITVWYDGKVALSNISLNEIKECEAELSDCECGIDYVAKLKNIRIAVFIREIHKDYYKVSFRSKYNINVAEIASLFGGGGHKKASGCAINGNYYDVRDKVLSLIGEYI